MKCPNPVVLEFPDPAILKSKNTGFGDFIKSLESYLQFCDERSVLDMNKTRIR